MHYAVHRFVRAEFVCDVAIICKVWQQFMIILRFLHYLHPEA